MEVKRIPDVEAYPSYETACIHCDKVIRLNYNGGELDGADCCGLRYSLESPQTDFVITDPATQPIDSGAICAGTEGGWPKLK